MRKRMWAVIACLILSGCRLYEPPRYQRLHLPAGSQTIRVLMIGDSLTYYNDLPGLLQQLSGKEAKPIYVEQITTPGASLALQWNINHAQGRIAEGHWDYVVLQEYSRKPVTDPDDAMKYIRRFNDQITRGGAKTMLFENWTVRGKSDEYDALYDFYQNACDETAAAAAPIGTAWRNCREHHPKISLLLDDRHPTDEGTYLAACVLYDVIYHKRASALRMDLDGPDLPRETKILLRRIADETVIPPVRNPTTS